MTINVAHRSSEDWDGFNYDHRSSKVVYEPHDLWRRLQDECPTIFSRKYGGFWFVSRFEDVRKVLTNWELYTSAAGTLLPPNPTPLIPMESDPPLHRHFRSVLNPTFSPKAVACHEAWIREAAKAQIASISGAEFDVCEAFARPFPEIVALRVLGFPETDRVRLTEWIKALSHGTKDEHDAAGTQAGLDLYQYLLDTLHDRQTSEPCEDLISLVQQAQINGDPISEADQISVLMLLLFGGLHTTSSVLAAAIHWLADHPEDRARLTSQPELFATAVDEFVRFASPAVCLSRVATSDHELGGAAIAKGDRVMFGIGAANRDPRIFDSPDDVRIDRSPNPHLGFGAGPHRCVGSHLGRLQVEIGLAEFLHAFSTFEITDHAAIRWKGSEARGVTYLPIRVARRVTQ